MAVLFFIGELYFMLLVTSQVKHLMPFPRMEMHQNTLNKMGFFLQPPAV